MEIVDVKATPLRLGLEQIKDEDAYKHRPHPWGWMSCLVEVETDEGLTGIGEACAGGKMGDATIGVKAFIEKGYRSVLLGEDPTNYRYLWHKMYNYSWYAETGIGMSALSGVDMALVDLTGKVLGIPACKVLGGSYRTKVRVYASHPWISPKISKETCKWVVELVEQGFDAIKLSLSQFQNFGKNVKEDVKYIKEIRDATGYGVDLMISDSARHSVSKAINISKRLEEYDLLFYEDPLPRGDIEGYAKLTAAVDLPIEAGEEMTNEMLRNFILRRVVDAVNPDVAQHGGLSESKKIADLAHALGIQDYPHAYWSAISTAANVHLTASMPDGYLMEYRVSDPDPSMEEILLEPLKFEKGNIGVPKKPGLGIELNKKVVDKITWKG